MRETEREPRSFDEFVATHGERRLLDGSHFDGTMKEWKEQRGKVAEFMRDGTILDIGSANGFLLRCLQEWSRKKLDGYGIDADHAMVEQAKQLFPRDAKKFVSNAELPDSGDLSEMGFPRRFDTVYWNVWDNFDLTSEAGRQFFERLGSLVDQHGSFVIGSYRPTREGNEERIKELESLGWEDVEKAYMGDDRPEMVMRVVKKKR